MASTSGESGRSYSWQPVERKLNRGKFLNDENRRTYSIMLNKNSPGFLLRSGEEGPKVLVQGVKPLEDLLPPFFLFLQYFHGVCQCPQDEVNLLISTDAITLSAPL